MKKYFLVLLMVCCCFITGCFGNNKDDTLKEIKKKYDNLKAYQLTGNLEIVNNDDTYNYDVKVVYQKKDKYYVSLKNRSNNHEQIILKNEDGVYVLTPSLNKSFKFQSDWPYNNSQVYLIQSILDDILDDEERSLIEDENSYIFTTNVNYPNNRKLVKQKVTFDKKFNLKKVSVVDENDIGQMTMTFATIDINPDINNEIFDLNKIMGTTENNNKEETTGNLEDIIYPLYIPTGTTLSSQEKIAKTDGERVIMTFEGEKPFLLVEETSSIEEEFSIIPTYGEPYLLIDTVGALTDSSITWSSNGVDYYLVSDVMSQDELLDIARSVNVIPTMK
ncbi:MAG: outer membrane lipoprotein carrier protein LolA [Tenericutes bacterium]|nr:outer membrane lipoprotein carrier protein LolA [Mycoplasmatota bacterium]